MDVKEIAELFCLDGCAAEIKQITQGYINATYCITTENKSRYVLQRINTDIFKAPYELMENIQNVTSHIRKKVIEYGGNERREVLTIVKTRDGKLLLDTASNGFWRMYLYIEGATSYQSAEKPELFLNSAKAFGKFQRLLADFPADTLHETIPRFHDTKDRYMHFVEAVENDAANRAALVQEEINFIKQRESACGVILKLIEDKKIPLRVTHNDTKLNNIMMDNKTNEGICVLDLDTVMPGTVLFDFGDSIRFGASTASEDEKDLSKVSISKALFEEYAKGYLSEAKSTLNNCEVEHLVFGARIITLEQAIRFLTDYLVGDKYYPVKYQEHNLDRARTQIKLVYDIEQKSDELCSIISKYSE